MHHVILLKEVYFAKKSQMQLLVSGSPKKACAFEGSYPAQQFAVRFRSHQANAQTAQRLDARLSSACANHTGWRLVDYGWVMLGVVGHD